MADSDNDSGGGGNNREGEGSSREQDRLLPIANVSRIMKKALPANAKISKDAKETVQECVSEFISFVTGEASDKCQREKRKTINGDDLLWAMTTLGFEDYVDPLKIYLHKYRELEGEKTAAPTTKDSTAGGGSGGGMYGGVMMMGHHHNHHQGSMYGGYNQQQQMGGVDGGGSGNGASAMKGRWMTSQSDEPE